MIWNMYAYLRDGKVSAIAIGPERYVRLHGLTWPIVQVTVREDPEGSYLGWVDGFPGGTTEPRMIQREALFDMQFPYGAKAEENAGKGRVVRLSVEVAPDVVS